MGKFTPAERASWYVPDDEFDYDAIQTGGTGLGSWADARGEQITVGGAAPYEALSESETGQRLLRHAQKSVADQCVRGDGPPTAEEVDETRWWLAALGLIPDPYDPAPTRAQRNATTRRVVRQKKKKMEKENPNG